MNDKDYIHSLRDLKRWRVASPSPLVGLISDGVGQGTPILTQSLVLYIYLAQQAVVALHYSKNPRVGFLRFKDLLAEICHLNNQKI